MLKEILASIKALSLFVTTIGPGAVHCPEVIVKFPLRIGRNIHGTGIQPDVEVELDEGLRQQVKIEQSEDNQLQKAIEVVKGRSKSSRESKSTSPGLAAKTATRRVLHI